MNRNVEIWKKAMKIGRWAGCHQMPERSFFFKKYQFPVCARCTGVLIGYIISSFTWLLYIKLYLSIFCSAIMFIDWFVQYMGWRESTNLRRLITGISGGYGILSIQIIIIINIIKFIISA